MKIKTMTWDDIPVQNNSPQMRELTEKEVQQVSGGGWATAALGAAAGYAASHGLPRLNRIVVAVGAGAAAY